MKDAPRLVMLPREPLEEMVCVGDKEILDHLDTHRFMHSDTTPAKDCYVAMVEYYLHSPAGMSAVASPAPIHAPKEAKPSLWRLLCKYTAIASFWLSGLFLGLSEDPATMRFYIYLAILVVFFAVVMHTLSTFKVEPYDEGDDK